MYIYACHMPKLSCLCNYVCMCMYDNMTFQDLKNKFIFDVGNQRASSLEVHVCYSCSYFRYLSSDSCLVRRLTAESFINPFKFYFIL